MASHVLNVLLNSGPRFPSIREQADKLKTSIAEKQASKGKTSEPSKKSKFIVSSTLELSTNLTDRAWVLDQIAEEWSMGGKSPRISGKEHRKKELDVLPLVANIEPGSHLALPKSSSKRLPFPVLIPQRCPSCPGSSFVGIYPPILEDHFVGRNAFGRFIEGMNKVVEASGGLEEMASRIDCPEIRQYVDESNRQVYHGKGLQVSLIRFSGPGATDTISCQNAIFQKQSNEILDQLNIEERADGMTATAARFIYLGLERAAVSAAQGEYQEIERLLSCYKRQREALQEYFDERLATKRSAGLAALRSSSTHQTSTSRNLFQQYKDRPGLHHVKPELIYLTITRCQTDQRR